MQNDAPFDPCRQWLGIDAVELVTPHRVLGISPLETDPLVIVRAADQKLGVLRSIDPGPLGRARDALVTRVEQARDARAGCRKGRHGGSVERKGQRRVDLAAERGCARAHGAGRGGPANEWEF
jgi:hypothetical protein